MSIPFYKIVLALLTGIGVILLLPIIFRVPSFFALLIACLVTGIGVGSALPDTLTQTKKGIGNIRKSLSLLITPGTTLGVVLEKTGSTRVMANDILKKTGEQRAMLAMSITGFIGGLPLFCDSGYIVLSGLNDQVAKRTGISVILMAVSLATGLVSIHCLIPPQSGASAAAAMLNVDFGRLIAVVLTTAQGSSTVAIITAASIIQPLLPGLGLTSDNGRLLCVLSMGAGSMIISHANDAYFWVVSRFSGLDMKIALSTYSLSNLWMGLISMFTIYICHSFYHRICISS